MDLYKKIEMLYKSLSLDGQMRADAYIEKLAEKEAGSARRHSNQRVHWTAIVADKINRLLRRQ